MSTPSFRETADRVVPTIRTLFAATPLIRSKLLSERYGAEIYLKREDLTPVRSYKIRGAFHFIATAMSAVTPPQEFVCASAGNHAQGFAFACARYGVRGVVYMPVTTPSQKVEKTRVFGGEHIEIRLVGDTFDAAATAAKEYCATKDAMFVPPFDHPTIALGQATVAAEIFEKMTPDVIVIPVGGGGLASGVVQYAREANPETTIICAEPVGAASLAASITAGEQITLDRIDTFVDGAAVKRIGDYNFGILKEYLTHDIIRVPENRLCATMVEFLNHEGVVLEPAGALAIDALRDVADEIRGKKVVCVASGGNFDFEQLPDVKERAMKWRGVKKYFILRLPQRPCALRDFLNLLGPDDDIARFEYLKKSSRDFGAVLIGVESSAPEQLTALFDRMTAHNFAFTDVTTDPLLAEFLI